MKKRMIFIVSILILIVAVIVPVIWFGNKNSKEEDTRIDDGIISVEEELIYGEDTEVQDNSAADNEPSKEDETEGNTDDIDNPYNLDKDGDGFVDGWY